jgi:hypothetical protein
VNYFPSFQTLSAVSDAHSSAKFVVCLAARDAPVAINPVHTQKILRLKTNGISLKKILPVDTDDEVQNVGL